MLKSNFIISLIIIVMTSLEASAAKCVNNQQLFVNSDNLTYDNFANLATFEGNVVLWFDDIILKTTNIKIYYKQVQGKNIIDKIIIPEKLSALKTKDSDVLIADRAIYNFDKNELSLSGNVVLQHDNNILKTDKLVLVTELRKINNY